MEVGGSRENETTFGFFLRLVELAAESDCWEGSKVVVAGFNALGISFAFNSSTELLSGGCALFLEFTACRVRCHGYQHRWGHKVATHTFLAEQSVEKWRIVLACET